VTLQFVTYGSTCLLQCFTLLCQCPHNSKCPYIMICDPDFCSNSCVWCNGCLCRPHEEVHKVVLAAAGDRALVVRAADGRLVCNGAREAAMQQTYDLEWVNVLMTSRNQGSEAIWCYSHNEAFNQVGHGSLSLPFTGTSKICHRYVVCWGWGARRLGLDPGNRAGRGPRPRPRLMSTSGLQAPTDERSLKSSCWYVNVCC